MKDISALLAGLIPWALLRYTDMIPREGPVIIGIVVSTLFVFQVAYSGLNRWRHNGILTILALGLPVMAWVYVIVNHPLFAVTFYVLAALVVLSSLLSALLNNAWGWEQVAVNIAFFAACLILAANLAALSGIEALQASVLTGCAYAITRLCGVDLLSWIRRLPPLIWRGLEKLWF